MLLLKIIFVLVSLSLAVVPKDYDKDKGNYVSREKMHQQVQENVHVNHDIDEEDELLYYFEKYDFNGDDKLDGNELRLAFDLPDDGSVSLAEFEEMADHALLEDDLNNDGAIDWEEYLTSQSYHE